MEINFIQGLTKNEIKSGIVPIREILTNSAFYPACGIDGGLVRDCNINRQAWGINSFVYSDYALDPDEFLKNASDFNGYSILAIRDLKLHDLVPNGWNQKLPPGFNITKYNQYSHHWRAYAYWLVYERNTEYSAEHGPMRFSLLYIGGEAVATYQALYCQNQIVPVALALIRPGNGFGLNYTDFNQSEAHLHWVVQSNLAGMPKFIYNDQSVQFYWPEYRIMEQVDYYGQHPGLVDLWYLH